MRPPTVVPTPTTQTGMSLVRASFSDARHLAAPRLSVGDQHERLRVRRLAVELLSFSISRMPQAMPSSMLVSQVVSSSRRNGDSCVEVIEEEEEGVRILASAGPAAWRCARTAPSRCGRPSTPATRRASRRNRIERCQRSPATSGVRIDAEPSCRMTRSTPAVRTSETAAVGRASARIVQALARIRHSQNSRPPKIGNRSRTGSRRCCRKRRASRRRARQLPAPRRPAARRARSAATGTAAPRTEPSLEVDACQHASYPSILIPTSLSPQALSLSNLLPALARVGLVLAFVAALRDDDLELLHVGGRRRSARLAVQRRTGGQIGFVNGRLTACGAGFRRGRLAACASASRARTANS